MDDASRRKKRNKTVNFSIDGSSHQTGDAAFTPATLQELQHSRANTDLYNSHNTQHTRVKQNTLFFMQKDTKPSQTCSGGHITSGPNFLLCQFVSCKSQRLKGSMSAFQRAGAGAGGLPVAAASLTQSQKGKRAHSQTLHTPCTLATEGSPGAVKRSV